MKFKKFLAMILALAMAVSVMTVSVSAAQLSDINGHWAETSIQRWANAGIINGYEDGTFKPGNPIKRAEFATILAKTLGLSGTTETKFSDVSGHWAENAIYACAAAGIVGGYPDGTFLPEKNITREEAMKMYSEAIKIVGESGTDAASYLKDKFTDGAAVSSWASGYAYSMVSNGAMEGSNGELRPKANITRAEVAIILDRLAGVYVSKDGTVSTTTAEQQAKGYMGNSIVVHYDATATVTADQEGNVTVTVGETVTEVKLDEAPTLIYDNKDHDLSDNQVDIKPGDITIVVIPEEKPTEPSTTPTEPSTEATEPSAEATEPSTQPSTEATEPSTEPSTEATDPSEETEPSTEATEPEEIIYHAGLITERKEIAHMGPFGDIVTVTKYTYDETINQVIKAEQFTDDELVSTYTAEFDDQGRAVKVLNGEIPVREYKYDGEYLSERIDYETAQGEEGNIMYHYFYKYNDNGDIIEEIRRTYSNKDEYCDYRTTYEYSESGFQIKYTKYVDDVLDREYSLTLDEDGYTYLKEEFKVYEYTAENEQYISYYDINIYENDRLASNKSISYDEDGTILNSSESVREYTENGYKQTNIADGEVYETIVYTGEYTESGEGETYLSISTNTFVYYDSDGTETTKYVEVTKNTDVDYLYTTTEYTNGEAGYSEEQYYNYETGENWYKEYSGSGKLISSRITTVKHSEEGYEEYTEERSDWGSWDMVDTYKIVEVSEDYRQDYWFERYY